MAKKQQSDKSERRTKVKDLPKKEKELSKDEQKKVKGEYIEEDPIRRPFNLSLKSY